MWRKVDRWLWKDTLEPHLVPLEVLPEVVSETQDLLAALSAEVARLVRQIEEGQEALERRRALELAGNRSHPPQAEQESNRQFARTLLPSLDALDRVIEFGDESLNYRDEVFKNWLIAIKAVRTRLMKTLEGIGLVPLSSIGSEVDLNIHDVVSVVPAGEYPANTVVAERQKGYYFKGKLLRDAKVVVAQ